MLPRVPGVSRSRFTSSLRLSSSDIVRRVNHGGAAWLKRRDYELRQPQDGAPVPQNGIAHEHTRLEEAADAQMTGATRSLGNRLLGLNVAARASAVLPPVSVIRSFLPRRPLLPKTTLLKA